jgi:hypothetical protein
MILRNISVLIFSALALFGCNSSSQVEVAKNSTLNLKTDLPLSIHPQQSPESSRTVCTDFSSERSKESHPTASLSPYLEDDAQVLLQDCRLLKIGGYPIQRDANDGGQPSTLVQVYDRGENQWSQLAPLPVGLYLESATLMNDGNVFVVGGAARNLQTKTDDFSKDAFIYNVKSNVWTKVTGPQYVHVRHQTVILSDGRLLVVGTGTIGSYTWPDNQGTVASYSEIYDPTKNEWSSSSQMTSSYYINAAYVLNDGRVLATEYGGGDLRAEIYDELANSWQDTNLDVFEGVSTLMPDGNVMLIAPIQKTSWTPNAIGVEVEKFDPKTSAWIHLTTITTAKEISGLRNSLLTIQNNTTLLFWGGYDDWFGGLVLHLDGDAATEFGAMQSGINISETPVQPIQLSRSEILITPNSSTEVIGLPK